MFAKLKNLETDFTLGKAAAIVGIFTLLIKFVAIYRDRLFSGTFGQGPVLDSYYAAFRIPDFLTTLLVTSTLSVAFLPVFSALMTKNKEEANRFTDQVMVIGGLCLAAFSLILLAFSRIMVHALVPGFTDGEFANTLGLTRLFLLSPLIFALGTVYGGVLNAKKQFLISSFAPMLYNLGIIAGVIFLYPRFGIMGLGYGVILGALAQLLVQIVACYYQGYYFKFALRGGKKYLSELWRLYLPRVFSFDLSNITLLLGTMIGSALMSGSITGLNQAYNLQAVPVAVFGFPIALAIFPVLSEVFALGDEKTFIESLGKSISQTLFFIIPISVLTLLYRAHIVRLILGTGKFSWEDTTRTFQILGIFCFSFLSQSLTTLLGRAFFARHNTKTPVLINIAAIIINIILGFALRAQGVMGLTVAFVVASCFNAIALLMIMRKNLGGLPELRQWNSLAKFDDTIYETAWKVGLASILMGLVCFGLLHLLAHFLNTHKVLGLLLQAGVSSVLGLGVFVFLVQKLKVQHQPNLYSIFARRLKVQGVINEGGFSDKTKN